MYPYSNEPHSLPLVSIVTRDSLGTLAVQILKDEIGLPSTSASETELAQFIDRIHGLVDKLQRAYEYARSHYDW